MRLPWNLLQLKFSNLFSSTKSIRFPTDDKLKNLIKVDKIEKWKTWTVEILKRLDESWNHWRQKKRTWHFRDWSLLTSCISSIIYNHKTVLGKKICFNSATWYLEFFLKKSLSGLCSRYLCVVTPCIPKILSDNYSIVKKMSFDEKVPNSLRT